MLLRLWLEGLVVAQWWRDVHREGRLQGHHREVVARGLRKGVVFFILSEVCFFFSFFWAFFHVRLAPGMEGGGVWPPAGVEVISPFGVPLLNTVVLLGSGVAVTWAHIGLLGGEVKDRVWGLGGTCLLGLYFLVLQGYEYYAAPYCLSDSRFGSVFFVATGFHGLHVAVGSLFLGVCLGRLLAGGFRRGRHLGFEGAA